jgi:hypothetical protein
MSSNQQMVLRSGAAVGADEPLTGASPALSRWFSSISDTPKSFFADRKERKEAKRQIKKEMADRKSVV